MKILQISSGDVKIPVKMGGAIELHVFSISKEFIKIGHDVTIIDRDYGDDKREKIDDINIERIKCKTIKLTVLKNFNLFRIISKLETLVNQVNFALKINKFIKRNSNNFDVIHIHLPIIGLIIVLFNKEARPKIIYTSHLNTFMMKKPSMIDSIYMNISAFLMKSVKVVALTEELKNKYAKKYGVPSKNITVVPNGINTDIFYPSNDNDIIKQKYDIENKNIILFVGRITEAKGVKYLIDAANIVINNYKCKDTIFVLVGSFGEFDSDIVDLYYYDIIKLIEKYKLKNYIKLTGAIPFNDLTKLYSTCDIFILPSLYEGFPMSSLEAMSSGKPVICSNIQGLNTQVKDGYNGFLTNPTDSIKIAEYINLLIVNKEKRIEMGKNSREFVEKNLTWHKISEELLKIYKKIKI